jgi:hypothetical protein
VTTTSVMVALVSSCAAQNCVASMQPMDSAMDRPTKCAPIFRRATSQVLVPMGT